MNSVTATVILYQEPLPAGVQPDDTIIYFRQFLPLWADTVEIGLGTWKDWDWFLAKIAKNEAVQTAIALD